MQERDYSLLELCNGLASKSNEACREIARTFGLTAANGGERLMRAERLRRDGCQTAAQVTDRLIPDDDLWKR